MEKKQFIKLMSTILIEENHQNRKAKFIKSSLTKEVMAIRRIGRAINIKVSNTDIVEIIQELTQDILNDFKL